MKKFLKKNNKGFSLVELIVVILIIAIIAVALAPQVIKWVGEASDSTKKSNAATLKSAVQTCVAEYIANGGKVGVNGDSDADTTFTVRGTTVSTPSNIVAPAKGSTLKALVEAALADFTDTSVTYTVTITKAGSITVSYS